MSRTGARAETQGKAAAAHRSRMTRASLLGLEEAVDHVLAGGLLGFPTETTWGLGALAARADSVAELRLWKGRAAGKPLSVLVDGEVGLRELAEPLAASAEALVQRFWPGPLTLVVPAAARLAPGVARSDGALGVRCSPHPVAAALARALRRRGAGPLVATSLNRAGSRPVRTRGEAEALCAGPCGPALVAGPDAGGAVPSTVIDLTGSTMRVLRAGALDPAALRELCTDVIPATPCCEESP